mmetsp:Transcript_19991/g.27470  ORF Transcript_19991/g.27470 Transcript_19991/m.27470 type:complete len:171 (-) Transcript_19991:18-530(-)
MWLKGSFNPPDPDGIVLVDNTDLSIRNQDAINNAQQSQSVSHVQINSADFDNISCLTASIDNGFNTGDGDVDKDGDEHLTVHTAKTPAAILADEQKVVAHLGDLNDPTKGVLFRDIKIGGNLTRLQTFHYPALNTEAPRNKKQRTYIDANDLPSLFSYEFKAALTVRILQ